MNFKKLTAVALSGAMIFAAAACNNTTTTTTTAAPGTDGTTVAETTPEATDGTTAAPAEATKITLTLWSPSDDQAESQGAWLVTEANAFAEANKDKWDITFEYGEAGEGEARDKVLKDVSAAGNIYMYANDQVNDLIGGNALARLGGDAEKYVLETNAESVSKSVTVDGAVYGLPFTTNTWFMYYNTDIFTADDVKSLDAMLAKGKVAFPLTNSWYIASFYLANGGTMFGPDGTDNEAGINFGGANGVAVTNYLVDLVANPNFVNDADGVGKTGLNDGSIGAIFSGSWDYNDIHTALGDKMGAAQLPTITIDGAEKQLLSFGGTKAIGVNPSTPAEAMPAAVALAQWLVRPEAQQSHYELRNIVPTNLTLLEDPEMAKNPMVIAQNDTMANTSFLQPFVTNMSNWWTPAENFGKALNNGEVTKDNAEAKTEEFNTAVNTAPVS